MAGSIQSCFVAEFLNISLLMRHILLLDGHSSHYCPEAIKACAEERVTLLALPPNMTLIIQPLDQGCFSLLKFE